MRALMAFCLIVSMVSSSSCAISNVSTINCQSAINAFMANPSHDAFLRVSKTRGANCWGLVSKSNDYLFELEELVGRGEPWAARYMAENIKTLDGGNLEDSLISLGRFADHDMEGLLGLARDGLLSQTELTDSLTMLPLYLSDDSRAQLSLLRERKDKVMLVKRASLRVQKDQALRAINEFEEEIINARNMRT